MKNRVIRFIYIFFRAIIIAILLVLPMMKIAEWFENRHINKIKLNAAYTKSHVTRTFYSKFKCVEVEYYISNGVFKATRVLGSDDKLYIQYYKVMYDSTKPEDAEILIEEPLFKRTDNIDSTYASIIKVGDINFIRYEYQVNNIKYKKFQKYFDVSNFKIGQKIVCFYVKESPETAILDYPNFKVNQKYLYE
jgi:hypothetical protein